MNNTTTPENGKAEHPSPSGQHPTPNIQHPTSNGGGRHETYRVPPLISPQRVSRFLLESAKRERAAEFTRVSPATIEHIESLVRATCLRLVQKAPANGGAI